MKVKHKLKFKKNYIKIKFNKKKYKFNICNNNQNN